jgi:YfiR/HmsC-like
MYRPKQNRSVWWLAVLSQALTVCLLGAGDDRAMSEYQVKAAFLYNFTKFVSWPAIAFPTTNSPFVLGIAGNDPFGKSLDEVVRNETVGTHPIQVRRLRAGDDLGSCHMLFISGSEKEWVESMLAQLRRRPILFVGDTAGFAVRGVTVNLLLVQGSRPGWRSARKCWAWPRL